MSEHEIALREAAEIYAANQYFEARPMIDDNTFTRHLFEDGFRRGWDARVSYAESKGKS